MKKTLSVLSLGLSFSALAALHQAPPAFNYNDGEVVFVDIETADYNITYDLASKTVQVESVIIFEAPKSGYAIFDLVPEPLEMTLNDAAASSEAIRDPDDQTTMRVLEQRVEPGKHELKIKHNISTNVIFGDTGVASGFWMSDLNDRRYLEQYLPTNLEYDQYKMKMKVNVVGGQDEHVLKANGSVSKLEANSFEVVFPDFYSTSSVFFHLFPAKNTANNVQFYYPSVDGRLIPVDIYTSYDITPFVENTKTILAELEADYGPFPHNQLIIYGNSPSGGMEYAGATATSLSALGHELFHSYHARALMPANGNAGWMDEAIARWRDNKYPLVQGLTFDSTRVAGHSVWSRMTDRMAYREGSAFLSWIAYRMNDKGLSFKTFLKDYFQKYKYTTVTTPLFQEELTVASSMDLSTDFNRYIYGKFIQQSKSHKARDFHFEQDPNHPILTKEQLLELTWL